MSMLHRGPLFRDRQEAGRLLAASLSSYGGRDDVVVLALPRGGVPVAYEIALALRAPLDVFIVRKLGLPGHTELAVGAIASGGVVVLNEAVVRAADLSPETLRDIAALEKAELERREQEYRDGREPPDLAGKTVILVDDGLATGATMRAAIAAVRSKRPARVVVAVPVASADTCRELEAEADHLVCGETPEPFYAVGAWYEDFEQLSDDDVKQLLARLPQEVASQ